MTQKVTLSSGVVLEVRPVSPFVVSAARMRLPLPAVPIVEIEGKGREEENPNDPAYVKALSEYEEKVLEATVDAIIAVGCKVMSVPEGFSGPDDEEWIERLAPFVSVPADKTSRYALWVRMWAIQTADDWVTLNRVLRGLAGTAEAAVAQATEAFPDRT